MSRNYKDGWVKEALMNAKCYDWIEDFHLENGMYFGICLSCGVHFTGHKRRTSCKNCHIYIESGHFNKCIMALNEVGRVFGEFKSGVNITMLMNRYDDGTVKIDSWQLSKEEDEFMQATIKIEVRKKSGMDT